MTYKLEPGLSRVTSPVRLVFPTGEKKDYESGAEVTDAVFNQRYRVVEIRARGDVVEVVLDNVDAPSVNWTGEEQTFF